MKISQPRSQAWIKDGISSKRSAIDTKCYNDSLMEFDDPATQTGLLYLVGRNEI